MAGLAAPASSGAPSAPAGGAVVDETALSSWTFPTETPNRSRWFFAGAFRDAAAGGKTKTLAFAVRGRCVEVRDRGGRGLSCHGRGIGGNVPADRFHMDPALRTARLVIKDGRASYELTWRAARRSVPYMYFAAEGCEEGSGEGAGTLQPASASGELFGRRLAASDVDSAMLGRGAMVTECARSIPLRTLRRAAAGQRIHVVFR